MPIPDRPVDDAEIATEWGQEIHDRVFAPKGCLLSGGPASVADNSIAQIDIDTAIEDPGGWLDDPLAEAPVGAEGLYTLSAIFKTDDVDESVTVRVYVKKNGSEIARNDGQGDGSVQMNIPINTHTVIAAGDQFTTFAKKIGTAGAAIDVELTSISLVRLGAEYGA